jgi:hypothetical protein
VIPVFSKEVSYTTGITGPGQVTTVFDLGGPTGDYETVFIQGVNVDGAIAAALQGFTAYLDPSVTGLFSDVQFYVVDKQARTDWPVSTTVYLRYMTVILETYDEVNNGGGTGGATGGGPGGGGGGGPTPM